MKYKLVVNDETGYILNELDQVAGLWFAREEYAKNQGKIQWTIARLDTEGFKVSEHDYMVAVTGGGRIQHLEQKPYGVFLWLST